MRLSRRALLHLELLDDAKLHVGPRRFGGIEVDDLFLEIRDDSARVVIESERERAVSCGTQLFARNCDVRERAGKFPEEMIEIEDVARLCLTAQSQCADLLRDRSNGSVVVQLDG